MKFDTIDTVTADPFMITWDLGRRCNYDCTYCAPVHHDNFSPHASFEELKNTSDFIFNYITIIAKYRTNKEFHINLTGGEPTNNPNFLEFVNYLKTWVDKLANTLTLHLALTTNGTMGKRLTSAVIETFNFVTVSYHTEADDKLKQNVIDRIKQIHTAGKPVKVNVMFHAHYFDECVNVCSILKQDSIDYIPRMLGENPAGEKDYGHKYTPDQIAWFNNYWGVETSKEEAFGASIGRPCCGGRSMCVSNSTESKEVKFLTYRKFKDWHCSVNWYFLHIEQQTDSVFHHQSCKARFDNTAGPIGKISEADKIITELENNLTNNTMPIVVCPNTFCGCGLCTPKSQDKDKLLAVLADKIDCTIFR